VKPTAYQSESTPSLRINPAMPRNDAADRYSPVIAAALRRERTMRRATRKSGVVLASREEWKPR